MASAKSAHVHRIDCGEVVGAFGLFERVDELVDYSATIRMVLRIASFENVPEG